MVNVQLPSVILSRLSANLSIERELRLISDQIVSENLVMQHVFMWANVLMNTIYTVA